MAGWRDTVGHLGSCCCAGMAHKGTSVVLYRSPAIRQHQFTAVTDWTGGLYISPGFAGSRSGALIATAWAAMISLGLDGYMGHTKKIMQARRLLCRPVIIIIEILGATPYASGCAQQRRWWLLMWNYAMPPAYCK